MFLEILAALLHFHQHDGFPDVIGERRAAAVLVGFADAKFGRAPHVETTGLAKGLKEPVEEDFRLAFFVARDVLLAPRGEFGEFVPARHGLVLPQGRRGINPELQSAGGVSFFIRVHLCLSC